MKLSEKAIQAMSTKKGRLALMVAFDWTEQWTIKQLKANATNGQLTKMAVLQVIQKETGLEFSQIVESNKVFEKIN